MPFPPSSTTRIGRTRDGSMKRRVASRNPGAILLFQLAALGGRWAGLAGRDDLADLADALVARERSAPRLTSLAPVYGFGLCDAVHIARRQVAANRP